MFSVDGDILELPRAAATAMTPSFDGEREKELVVVSRGASV